MKDNLYARRPLIYKVLEDTDADGNRGRLVYYAKCSHCGYDLDNTNDVCDSCLNPVDWNKEGDEE